MSEISGICKGGIIVWSRLRGAIQKCSLGSLLTGRTLLAAGRLQDAERSLRNALSLEDTAQTRVTSYDTLRKQGCGEEALGVLESASEAVSKKRHLREAYAGALLSAGLLKGAAAAHEELLKDEPEDAAVLNNLALVYGQLGNPEAIATARRAIQIDPRNIPALDTLGWMLVSQRSPDKGIKCLRDALVLDPSVLPLGCGACETREQGRGQARVADGCQRPRILGDESGARATG